MTLFIRLDESELSGRVVLVKTPFTRVGGRMVMQRYNKGVSVHYLDDYPSPEFLPVGRVFDRSLGVGSFFF